MILNIREQKISFSELFEQVQDNKALLKYYFNSSQFENSINQLKAENETIDYIQEYIYRAKTYLKFYNSYGDEK